MLRSQLSFVFLIAITISFVIAAPYPLLQYGSVYMNATNDFYFVPGVEDTINAVAYGYFNNTLNVTGTRGGHRPTSFHVVIAYLLFINRLGNSEGYHQL